MQQRNQSAKQRASGSKTAGAAALKATQADAAARTPAPARRGGRILLISLAVIALTAIAYRYMVAPQGVEQAQAPTSGPSAPPVTVAKPLVKTLREWKDFTGQFEAQESVEIRARVSGYLESVNFNDGQLVTKGDLLFVIEPRPYEIALESAKAQLTQAEAQLDLAKVQLERTVQLRKNDYASQQTFDERTAEVKSAAASRDNSIATVNKAQLNLDYTRVLAPVSGRVGQHEVSIGNLVVGSDGGSSTLLTTLVSLDPIWLMFNVSEGDGMTYKRLIQKGELESARSNRVQVEVMGQSANPVPLIGPSRLRSWKSTGLKRQKLAVK